MQKPTTVDNWTDTWTSSQTITVILSGTDASGEAPSTYYCVDTANTCTPTASGTTALVSCVNGQTCTQYVRYYSKDSVNNSETVISKTIRQDLQTPTITDNQSGDDTWYGSADILSADATFNVDFSDLGGSLLATAQYTVWSSTGLSTGIGTEIIGWTNIATNINAASYTTNWSIDFTALQEGINYISVRAYDNACVGTGHCACPSTNCVVATDVFYIKKDTSAPSASSAVYDGSVLGVDTEVSTSVTQLSANWSASVDNESGITAYWIAIGTSPGATDVMNWTDVGAGLAPALQATTVTGLSLTNGQTYYFSIKSVNGVGLQSTATTSDGLTVTAPSAPYTVSAGIHFNPTDGNNARKIVRDSAGNLYFAYYKSNDSSDQIFVAKSTDNGNTWADIAGAPIQTVTGYDQYSPSIAIDSQNNLHVMWTGTNAGTSGYYQIKYSTCTSASTCSNPANWSAWINKTSSTTKNQQFPTLRWSRWNNNGGSLDWGWLDDTTVMFNKDPTVNMSP